MDLYLISNEVHEPEGCLCDFKSSHIGINSVPSTATNIYHYVNSPDFHLYTICLTMPYKSVPIIRRIADKIIDFQLRKVAREIDAIRYDLVNIVGNYNFDRYRHLVRHISAKTVVSLHEVWNHAAPESEPSPLIKECIKYKTDILVYSSKSLNDIRMIRGIDISKVHVIPFGLYESFAALPTEKPSEPLPSKYLLFFGYVLPYKGLDVLYEAINKLPSGLRDYKVVIAGRGNDPVLARIVNDDRFVLLSRFIKNKELAYLIKHSSAILCPYKTMSQSGIPQTAFVFDKPIIASDLDGFRSVLSSDNSLLFSAGDSESLADKLVELINDHNLLSSLSTNISKFEYFHPEYSWSNIVKQYLLLIK